MGREIIYGRQPVIETLRASRRTVSRILVSQTMRPGPALEEVQKMAREHGIPIQTVPPPSLETSTNGGHHQGIAAEVTTYPYVDFDHLEYPRGANPLVLLLDHLQDPQNLGAIIRSAEAAGVHAILIPRDRAVGITPAVVRASAGATEHATICQVTNISQTMRKLKDQQVWLAGLELTGDSQLYTETRLSGPLGLVIGSEGEGLSRLTRETCDYLIRLPMLGKIGSLNASAAAAVALYEILRQRNSSAGA
jgi:23S rRNA (guanosine2251-2'-O)-methyltransferase